MVSLILATGLTISWAQGLYTDFLQLLSTRIIVFVIEMQYSDILGNFVRLLMLYTVSGSMLNVLTISTETGRLMIHKDLCCSRSSGVKVHSVNRKPMDDFLSDCV